MWWAVGGFAAFLYIVLLIWLGLRTLRRGHGWMFFFGLFLPIFWIIGAFSPPTAAASRQPI